jgi:hypothetical protein
MSDSTGLIMISSLGVASAFLVYYFSTIINATGDQIVIGFLGDHPIPAKQRWLLLYSRWVSYVTAAVAIPLFLAAAAILIANQMGDADIKLLGYWLAFLEAVASIIWLAHGGILFVGYRSILREAEAN